MAITTLVNFKALTGTTSTDKDDQITALIPQVEKDYLNIRNKPFDSGTKLTIQTLGLAADEEITVQIGNFAAVGGSIQGSEYDVALRNGDTADMIAQRIIMQIKPTPYYNIFIASAGTTEAVMYLLDRFPDYMEHFSVLDFAIDTSAAITTTIENMQTIYPDGAEMTAVQMIQHQMNTVDSAGVSGESLGDYSVQYAGSVQGVMGAYPKGVVGGIKRFAVTM